MDHALSGARRGHALAVQEGAMHYQVQGQVPCTIRCQGQGHALSGARQEERLGSEARKTGASSCGSFVLCLLGQLSFRP